MTNDNCKCAINENIFVNIYQLSKRARFINSYNLCVDILNAAKLTIKLSKMQGILRNHASFLHWLELSLWI